MNHQVSLSPSGHQFTMSDDETILAAAVRHGYHLPYGCRNGACGSCKGKILEGKVHYGHHTSSALTEAEKSQGLALFCCATPESDLSLQVREIDPSAGVAPRILPVRVQQMNRLADDVMQVYLKLPSNERLQYRGGQYIDLLLKNSKRRSYSLANPPQDDTRLELHIRHTPGGHFTDYLFNGMKEREILRLEGPLGSFFLRTESTKPIILVASGTGFAPVKALIEEAIHGGSHLQRQMTLYWGGRRPADIYMHTLCEQWTSQHPQIKFIPVVSEPKDEDQWQGRGGFVHNAVMQDFPDMSEYQVYVCGAPVVVEAARRDFIQTCRLPTDEFYADSFITAADLARATG